MRTSGKGGGDATAHTHVAGDVIIIMTWDSITKRLGGRRAVPLSLRRFRSSIPPPESRRATSRSPSSRSHSRPERWSDHAFLHSVPFPRGRMRPVPVPGAFALAILLAASVLPATEWPTLSSMDVF